MHKSLYSMYVCVCGVCVSVSTLHFKKVYPRNPEHLAYIKSPPYLRIFSSSNPLAPVPVVSKKAVAWYQMNVTRYVRWKTMCAARC